MQYLEMFVSELLRLHTIASLYVHGLFNKNIKINVFLYEFNADYPGDLE